MVNDPVVLTVAPMTVSPSDLSAGKDAPVTRPALSDP